MKSKILILGANGLLGNNLLNYFLLKNFKVKGVIRDSSKCIINKKNYFYIGNVIKNNKINISKLEIIIKKYKPNFIINSVGVTKKKLKSIKLVNLINSELPLRILEMRKFSDFKLIHFSTDCVFNGIKGNYTEKDKPNAGDKYGKSKFKGEINNSNCINIRTSMIGHSVEKENGLLEWFLNQNTEIQGYVNMFFTGPTCIEISKILENYIINKKVIVSGIINIGAKKISKYHLLKKISRIYKKEVKIIPNKKITIDRSLNINKFKNLTNYKIKNWDILLKQEKKYFKKFKINYV